VIEVLREAFEGERAWLVGGALRDRLLGRPTPDLDVVVDGDVRAAARRLGRGLGGASFELSDQFGAWRVVARETGWQVDITPLQGGSLEADLGARDLTVNAMAEPLGGGDLVDPFGGARDLAERRLRMVSPAAFVADPLRTIRVARLATELGFAVDPSTADNVRAHAGGLRDVSPERVFAELRRIVTADEAVSGMELVEELDLTDGVLPELTALRGVEQTAYHHRDVHGHTLEVLQAAIDLERDPAAALGDGLAEPVRALLAEPLADQLARVRASERLRAHVAALTRHHLRLGFLVHDMPLDRRAIYRYLVACEPVEADVTLLSVADRLATRGRKADEAIARHLELARQVLAEALARRAAGPQPPLVRGDELAAELGIARGPRLGELLARIAEARFAGEVSTRDEALALAREALADR
jgi:poly(A) polymerase